MASVPSMFENVRSAGYFDYSTGLTMTNTRFDALFGGKPRDPAYESAFLTLLRAFSGQRDLMEAQSDAPEPRGALFRQDGPVDE